MKKINKGYYITKKLGSFIVLPTNPVRLVTATKRFSYLVHLSFQKSEWCPLINGDDFIKLVTYENCFYLHYSLRWSCDLRNFVIPALIVIIKRCSASNGHSECMYRWFSRYAIASMLVDGKHEIAHQLAFFVHQHLFISPFLFESPEIA